MIEINSFLNTFDIVVLAAGKGSRMQSRIQSKPMHLLNGITLIEYLLLNLPLNNFNNKIAVVPSEYENIKSKINNVELFLKNLSISDTPMPVVTGEGQL